ncbi:MAG TPA: F0F1 ATP synthase subunit B [Casimicrobiaceae bacterium]|nr:F0F1 ATP synthase subunit B [Casimicrobiaceae bacterium]
MNLNLTLLMQAVLFGVFIWLCARYIWPQLMRAIDTRQKQIADGLAAGEEARQSLSRAEKQIAQMMTDAKTRASEIVAQGEKLKGETIEQARSEAKTEGDRLLVAAKAEIQQEVSRAKEALRNQVAELAVAGASQILKREVDAKAHADLLQALQRQL